MNAAGRGTVQWRARNLIALIGATVVALFIAACKQRPPSIPPNPSVTVAPAMQRRVTDWNDFTGQFAAVQTVEVRPRVSGYILQVTFREGAEVREGDTLFRIDSRPYAATLASAEAQLARARSALQLATTNAARGETLFVAHAMAREELETRTNALTQAAAEVRAAQAGVDTATLDLQWTAVSAPISGRVSRAAVTAGNYVQSGASLPPLTTIVSQDPIYVYFSADEQSYLKLTGGRGKPAMRGIGEGSGGRAVAIGLSNETGYSRTGRIDFIDNQLDGASGTIRLRAVLENHDRRLTPGLFARVRLAGGPPYAATVVQDRAVGTDQDRKFVYVVKPDSTVEYRAVQLGPVDDGLRALVAGVEPGEQVVVDGLQRVRPGVKVVAQLESPGADSASTARVSARSAGR